MTALRQLRRSLVTATCLPAFMQSPKLSLGDILVDTIALRKHVRDFIVSWMLAVGRIRKGQVCKSCGWIANSTADCRTELSPVIK